MLSLSRTEKTLAIVCALSLVPLLLAGFYITQRDAEPQWDIAPVPALPHPNGYDTYLAAARATVRFNPEVAPELDKVTKHSTAYALKNYSLARRQKWLRVNTRMFALLAKAQKMSSLSPDYANRSLADSTKFRHLARNLTVRSRTFQMEHQPMKATMSALDVMQLGQDTARGGCVINRLMGISLMSLGRKPLDDWNKTVNALSANEARSATKRLEAILAREPSASQTLAIEKRDDLIGLRRSFQDSGWRGPWARQQPLLEDEETFLQVWKRQTISKQSLYQNFNQILDAAIAAARLPYSRLATAPWTQNLDESSQDSVLVFDRYLRNEARNTTSENMLLMRLALRAYIAEHGQAPPTLSSLVPAYLKAIPTDVYNDGKPLFYKPHGRTYTLWSVGPDGINDGGVPLAPLSGRANGIEPVPNTLDNKGDFVAGQCR